MSNRYIVFVTDNAALVSIINKQTSKHKLVMTLFRDLVSTSLRFNIYMQILSAITQTRVLELTIFVKRRSLHAVILSSSEVFSPHAFSK